MPERRKQSDGIGSDDLASRPAARDDAGGRPVGLLDATDENFGVVTHGRTVPEAIASRTEPRACVRTRAHACRRLKTASVRRVIAHLSPSALANLLLKDRDRLEGAPAMTMPLESFVEDSALPTLSDPTTLAMRAERRLGDPGLRDYLRTSLRTKAPPEELDDLVSEALTRARRCRFLPDDDEMFRQYVFGIGRKVALDQRVRRGRRLETNAERVDGWDDGPSVDLGAVDAKLTLDMVMKDTDDDIRQGVRWLVRRFAGASYGEIAGEEGLPSKRVRSRAEAAREWLSDTLQSASVAAFILLLLWAIVRDQFKPRQEVATPPKTPKVEKVDPAPAPSIRDIAKPTPVESVSPRTSKSEPTLPKRSPTSAPVAPAQPEAVRDFGEIADPYEQEAKAAPTGVTAIRWDAQQACHNEQWDACLRGLDQAKAKDPAGDRTPFVKYMRAKAEERLHGK